MYKGLDIFLKAGEDCKNWQGKISNRKYWPEA